MVQQEIRTKWQTVKARYGEGRVHAIAILVLIGAASIVVRALGHYEFHTSALLYVGVPYLVSIVIVLMKPIVTHEKWWHQYRDHSLTALAVFLGSSIVLFEGFVCVLFFLPIYFLIVTLAFFIRWASVSSQRRRGKTFVTILPMLVILTAFEGTTDSLTVDRNSHVVVTRVASLSPNDVLQNLAMPFDLQKDRHWLLSIFPMPYEIDAGSLQPGDIHRVRTRYHRWFVTNTHEGELELQIVDVTPRSVRTRILSDTTFFSSYLAPLGTEINLVEIAPGQTEITLRINYRRKLDPAWYFHPLQQYGVGRMAEFLIDEVMIREQ